MDEAPLHPEEENLDGKTNNDAEMVHKQQLESEPAYTDNNIMMEPEKQQQRQQQQQQKVAEETIVPTPTQTPITNEEAQPQPPSALDLQVQKECLSLFSSTDHIMEPTIFDTIKNYFMHGGEPGPVVDLLSDNYHAVAQTVNLLAEWLILTGVPVHDVQLMVELHLKNLILKHFDPKKADTIFNLEGGAPAWLTEMIEHSIWRKMLYKLAEQHPHCLMLNFTIKLISDSGYEREITSVPVASQQVEVFSKVLKASIIKYAEQGIQFKAQNLQEIIELALRGEHTYLYTQMLLNSLYTRNKHECLETGMFVARRVSQEIELAARQKGYSVTQYTLALNGASTFPKVYSGLNSMLTKNALNTSDITQLYKLYSRGGGEPAGNNINNNSDNESNEIGNEGNEGNGNGEEPTPPIDLIRNSRFLDMLISYFFEPTSKPQPEHKDKYCYLLAYACSVADGNRAELDNVRIMIENAYTICHENKASSDLLGDLNELLKCMSCPVVAIGILKWVELIIMDQSYFKLNTDGSPIHLILLDDIVQNHSLLHERVLNLLIRLFLNNFTDLDNLVQIQLKKTIIDRMIHLMHRGYVLPVVAFLNNRWKEQDIDISLNRHFVMEVLEMIGPPYTSEFVTLFLPLINNEYIITSNVLKADEEKLVHDFIAYCKIHHTEFTSTSINSNTTSATNLVTSS